MIATNRVPDASQITAILSRLQPDSALQQYAQMHKNDPYIVSLAIAESNRRKAARQSQQAAAPVPTESIAPQEIQDISQSSQLPEDVGIGTLPTPNINQMANGGIVAFAGGGYTRAELITMIREEAARQGMDPDLAVRLFQAESSFDPNIVSNKGAVGLGQFMKGAAKDMGLTPEERTDPEKNIKASIGYYMRQLKQFGDPEVAAAAYNWGPDSVRKHLTKNEGQLNKVGLPTETANYLTKLFPVGAAQAAPMTPPAQVAPTTPAATAQPPELSVQVGEGYSPEGLEALGQRLDAIRSGVKNIPSAGLQQMRADPESAARFTAAQKLKQDAEAEYQQYASQLGLDKPAFMRPSAGYRSVVADSTPVAKQLAPDALTPKAPQAPADTSAYSGITPDFADSQGAIEGATRSEMQPATVNPATVIEAAKSTMTPEQQKQSGFEPEDWLRLGFSLMSGKSPYALQNLGQAGLATLEGMQAREKMGQDTAAKKAQTRLYEAQAGVYEAGVKDDLRKRQIMLNAMAEARKHAEAWSQGAGMLEVIKNPKRTEQKYQEVLQEKLRGLFPEEYGTMPQSVNTSGIKVLGVR